MKFDAVVFDLDGTLVDSAHAICGIAGRYLTELGAEPISMDETRSFVGNGGKVFAQRASRARDLPDSGPEFEKNYIRFREIYAAAPGSENPAYPGVQAMLDAIAGIPLAICTNKPMQPTANVVEALGWGKTFAVVVAGDTLEVRKPDPEHLLHTIRALGVAPQRTLYVGDSDVDADTATAANIPFALHVNGYRDMPAEDLAADMRFDDFAALADFIRTG